MSDPTNLNSSSPGGFNQPTPSLQQTLAPAQTNPSVAAASAPPSAAPNVSVPISQTAGSSSSASASSGLGGGVSVPSQGLGGGVSNPSPGEGVALLPGTPGPSTSTNTTNTSSGSGQLLAYPTPAALPAITSANVNTQARVDDIGNGTAGLYFALTIGPNTGWSFITVIA